tara:strand:- start:216 stop:527 length:312 start_codon:yes stop_codon:yes gene_type:complete
MYLKSEHTKGDLFYPPVGLARKKRLPKSRHPLLGDCDLFFAMKSFRKFFVRAMHGKIHPKKKAPFSSSYEKRSVKTLLTFFIKVLLIFARINTLYIRTLRSGK